MRRLRKRCVVLGLWACKLASGADLRFCRAQSKPLPLDEDLPGMGQFYCDVTGHVQRGAAVAAPCMPADHVLCRVFPGGTSRTQRHWPRT